MSKVSWLIVVAVCTAILGTGGIALAVEDIHTVGHGTVRGYDWSVEVGKESTSICFETVIEKPHNHSESNGVGQCSYPARRRGILLVVANPQKASERPKAIVIGAAFNAAVQKIRIVKFNGSVSYLHPHYLRSKLVSATVSRFKYLAWAVEGPWCARTFTTLDKHGHPLWNTTWKRFDVGWWRQPNSNPSKLCPH